MLCSILPKHSVGTRGLWFIIRICCQSHAHATPALGVPLPGAVGAAITSAHEKARVQYRFLRAPRIKGTDLQPSHRNSDTISWFFFVAMKILSNFHFVKKFWRRQTALRNSAVIRDSSFDTDICTGREWRMGIGWVVLDSLWRWRHVQLFSETHYSDAPR